MSVYPSRFLRARAAVQLSAFDRPRPTARRPQIPQFLRTTTTTARPTSPGSFAASSNSTSTTMSPSRRKPKILLVTSTCDAQPDPARRARLASAFDIVRYDCASVAEFVARLAPGGPYADIDAIVRTGWLKAGPYAGHVLFAADVIDHYPRSLRLICCSGHGYDAADVEKLTRRGIWYCNTPDACTEAVANTGLHLILNTFRYLTFAEHSLRSGQWAQSRQLGELAVDPAGRVLGVVGLGAIGLRTAQKAASALSMRVHYHNRARNPAAEAALPDGATYHATLDALVRAADCVLLACPYAAETHHLLSARQFALAKDGGVRIVNVARGKLVDEAALLEAMAQRTVVGVGLDVHENEPEVHPLLRDNWMVTLLPHVGVCSRTSWDNFERQCWENAERYFAEGTPVSPVNRPLGV